MLDALLDWSVLVTWIFGGCCSNVYALEAIVKQEPDSGLLITFAQFLLTALLTYPHHASVNPSRFFLKPRAVPLLKWIPNIVMFFAVNMMNNYAFGYNISVPVHIILRSGGSVMTMLVGWAWGKRYSRAQVTSVVMLTIGIIIAAMSDAQSKGRIDSSPGLSWNPEILSGLFILFLAQLLSAIMGLYVQLTYASHGSHWHENLFYSHFLSLPLFAPFLPSLTRQFQRLLSSPPLLLQPSYPDLSQLDLKQNPRLPPLTPYPILAPAIPKLLAALAVNAATQFACIRGVNMLASRTSAVGVSVALNVRKLVSLFISIWFFGNVLPGGVKVGAAVVFASAGLWAWEEGRVVREKEKEKEGSGREKKVQ